MIIITIVILVIIIIPNDKHKAGELQAHNWWGSMCIEYIYIYIYIYKMLGSEPTNCVDLRRVITGTT